MENTPTRRRLLGMFAAAAPAIALAAPTAEASPLTKADRFILAMEIIHPNGRSAAENAIAAGANPEDLVTVLTALGETKTGDWVPALIFATDGPEGYQSRCFRPRGEDRR